MYLVQPRLVVAPGADEAIGVGSFVTVWSSLPHGDLGLRRASVVRP
jgi:hypothetical protein